MTMDKSASGGGGVSQRLASARLLVVGAGGIGCELLKNLVLAGCGHLHVVDLDTIELSNLNRQFLFRKQHVGQPKAVVGAQSARAFAPDCDIVAAHASIMASEYDVQFFRSFDLVLNALDNRAARSHVNRMCLAAERPLIESATEGYLGQCTLIRRGLTECYDCRPQAPAKTYPACTIRNTPSQPVHCIVWAKHLFNQLFGSPDPHQDVSPDTADPEAPARPADDAAERQSTRSWAEQNDFDALKLLTKLFDGDVRYLLSMDTLWKERAPPQPLECAPLVCGTQCGWSAGGDSQRVWHAAGWGHLFCHSLRALAARTAPPAVHAAHNGTNGAPHPRVELDFDKDDDVALDFVAAAANLRCIVFGIATKSRFDVKAIAGNIVPAVSTTNAIIAGVMCLQAMRVLSGDEAQCRQVYIVHNARSSKKLLASGALFKPNPACYVCSRSELGVALDVASFTVAKLRHLLCHQLHMLQPDVVCNGAILLSADADEMEQNRDKPLAHFGVRLGSRLDCEDFAQNLNIVLAIEALEKSVSAVNGASEYELRGSYAVQQGEAAGSSEAREGEQSGGGRAESEGGTEARVAGSLKRARQQEPLAASLVDDEDVVCCGHLN